MPGDEDKVLFQPGPFPVQPPPSFNFEKTSEWPAWVQDFDDYRFASGLNERTEEAQVRTLLYTMGRQARKIFQTFNLTEEDSKKYAVVKQKFDDYFVAARNLVYESACFHRRCQEPGETVDQFATALHTLADRCDYGEVKERMVRDRFVVGLRDAKLSEALQMDATLTLASALAKARLKESVQRQQKELRSGSTELSEAVSSSAEVDAVRREGKPHGHRPRTKNSERVGHNANSAPKCSTCGRGPHSRSSCPARGAVCHKCGNRGHFAAVCSTKQLRASKVDASSFETGTRTANRRNFVCSLGVTSAKARTVEVSINDTVVSAKIDTGAEVSVVPASFPGLPGQLERSNVALKGPGNEELKVKGQFVATILWKRNSTRQTVFVIESAKSVILGLPAIEALGIVKFVDQVSVETSYPSLFNGLGTMKGEYCIRLKPECVPYAIHTARRIPIP